MPDTAAARPADATAPFADLAPVTLVLGGARSGKSAFAERLLARHPAPVYLATAQARDADMAARIAQHRARRAAPWTTVEEPLDLAGALERHALRGGAVLVECLTLWLSNLMEANADIEREIAQLESILPKLAAPAVLVSNEVGMGIFPANQLARAFQDHAGRTNQRLAALASRVVFVAAGLPLVLKDERR